MDFSGNYLAGLFDGEGSVNGPFKNGPRRVTITNTDHSIIVAAEECLRTLDIDYRTLYRDSTADPRTRDTKPVYTIVVQSRDNLILFNKLVPFRSLEKRAKLEKMIESYLRKRKRVRINGSKQKPHNKDH